MKIALNPLRRIDRGSMSRVNMKVEVPDVSSVGVMGRSYIKLLIYISLERFMLCHSSKVAFFISSATTGRA